MNPDLIDTIDREERVFKSFQAVIELMESSPSQEVREAQTLLALLVDEYQPCRAAMRQQVETRP